MNGETLAIFGCWRNVVLAVGSDTGSDEHGSYFKAVNAEWYRADTLGVDLSEWG